jgi:hypothetical protein
MIDRDPTKLLRMLEVHSGWLVKHDLRVGQFLMNVASFMGYEDPFYMENDALVDGIRSYIIAQERAARIPLGGNP